jgi:hypothetical protein
MRTGETKEVGSLSLTQILLFALMVYLMYMCGEKRVDNNRAYLFYLALWFLGILALLIDEAVGKVVTAMADRQREIDEHNLIVQKILYEIADKP